MVAAGTLLPETRLPTIRQLAADLGLAKGTVAKAYEMLEADGVIATRGRRGSFVLEFEPAEASAQETGVNVAAESLVVVARQLGVDREAAVEAVLAAWDRFSPPPEPV